MAAETRQRIVAAGVELLHSSDVRDWDALSIRAVADRAGVHERTIYRHFNNERGLRDAVMAALEEQAGVVLDGMQLEDVPKMTARIFEHVASFPLAPRPTLDPTLHDASSRLHTALLDAVAARTPDWSAEERTMAAGMLDVLWSVSVYERLVREWDLDADAAIQAVAWVMEAVEQAIGDGRAPSRK